MTLLSHVGHHVVGFAVGEESVEHGYSYCSLLRSGKAVVFSTERHSANK